MKFESKTVRRTINKAYLKEPIEREAFNQFKASFRDLIDRVQQAEHANEQEEHFKNLLPPCFKKLALMITTSIPAAMLTWLSTLVARPKIR